MLRSTATRSARRRPEKLTRRNALCAVRGLQEEGEDVSEKSESESESDGDTERESESYLAH